MNTLWGVVGILVFIVFRVLLLNGPRYSKAKKVAVEENVYWALIKRRRILSEQLEFLCEANAVTLKESLLAFFKEKDDESSPEMLSHESLKRQRKYHAMAPQELKWSLMRDVCEEIAQADSQIACMKAELEELRRLHLAYFWTRGKESPTQGENAYGEE